MPRLHAHLLRHTFATNYLVKEVGDPLRLQQILGHTSVEMVRHYVVMASVQRNLLERHAHRWFASWWSRLVRVTPGGYSRDESGV